MSEPVQRAPEVDAAEAKKFLAEAKAAEAKAAKDTADARTLEARAIVSKIAAERETEGREVELAEDYYKRVYRFSEGVNQASVTKAMRLLSAWSRIDPGCEITIVFTSPGGDIVAGMAFFDFIMELRRKDHRVVTKALGMAASMAGILLQAGDERIMAAESWLLIHQASFGAMGSFGEVEDRLKWVEMVQERIINIFAERSNLTKAQLKNRWNRKDWFISSDEAMKYGLVDAVE